MVSIVFDRIELVLLYNGYTGMDIATSSKEELPLNPHDQIRAAILHIAADHLGTQQLTDAQRQQVDAWVAEIQDRIKLNITGSPLFQERILLTDAEQPFNPEDMAGIGRLVRKSLVLRQGGFSSASDTDLEFPGRLEGIGSRLFGQRDEVEKRMVVRMLDSLGVQHTTDEWDRLTSSLSAHGLTVDGDNNPYLMARYPAEGNDTLFHSIGFRSGYHTYEQTGAQTDGFTVYLGWESRHGFARPDHTVTVSLAFGDDGRYRGARISQYSNNQLDVLVEALPDGQLLTGSNAIYGTKLPPEGLGTESIDIKQIVSKLNSRTALGNLTDNQVSVATVLSKNH